MEFIGIDIGAYKTVIASSKDNGKIITDEQGKRYIKTVFELTKPIRKFGNSITGEHELTINLRTKNFYPENYKNTYMWLKYLERTVKKQTGGNPTFCIAVPSSFGDEERRIIKLMADIGNIKLKGMFNSISSIGMFACIRREKTPKKFMIINFGHSLTEAGVFEFESNVFKPIFTKGIFVGASNFDDKLTDFIIHKYKLENLDIVREKICRSLEKVKTVLNASSTASVQFYITEAPLNVQITQEEFAVLVKDDVDKISQFIENVLKETQFDGVIEITGGNSSSFLIKEILDNKKIKYQSTLDLTESCAIGAALGFACSVIKSKFTINDIIGKDIFIDKTLVFKSSDVVGTKKKVTYNEKGPFRLELLEGTNLFASLTINKVASKEPEPVVITLEISKFGLVEVVSVESKSEVSFEYSVWSWSENKLTQFVEEEEMYRKMEDSIELIGSMRNDLETMVMNLSDVITSKFEDFWSSEEIDQIRNIGFDLFDVQQSSSVEEEEKVREEILSKLDFVTLKLLKHEEKLKEELKIIKEEILMFNKDNPKVFTPTFYKLQGLLYKIEDKIKLGPVDLFNVASYEYKFLDGFKGDVKIFIEKSKKEIKEKLEEEKREQELKKAKEEEEKKKSQTTEEEKKETQNKEDEKTESQAEKEESKDTENKKE